MVSGKRCDPLNIGLGRRGSRKSKAVKEYKRRSDESKYIQMGIEAGPFFMLKADKRRLRKMNRDKSGGQYKYDDSIFEQLA